jgi:saccharopine dehydrogenase-like NADP-dependent oxidoreductase
MKDKILVIGGYGQVGKIICRQLAATFPGKVIAAGRSYKKAEAYAVSIGGIVHPMQLDVNDLDRVADILQETRIAIMCLDHNDAGFVKACIEQKTQYIDISPSYDTLARIESLHDRAVEHGITALLGVGLAPGLSNMLVKYIAAQCERVECVDIFLMLGIGERHGRNGIQWLLNHLYQDFDMLEHTAQKRIKSFSDKKTTLFPEKLGRRMTYRFDLADQHILPKTLGVPNVSTRFCYDSALITTEMAILKSVGVFTLLKYAAIRNFFSTLLEYVLDIFVTLGIGSNVFAVKVDATGMNNATETRYYASIIGHNNTEVTALVTALVAEKLYANTYPSGIYYLEQIFEHHELIEHLKSYIKFSFATEEGEHVVGETT